MPIYAYRCTTCGHAQDVLQKMSDPVLTVCPACAAATYAKQVTAAGFQLKGSGWYVTDFRGGNTGAKKDDAPAADKPDKPGTNKPADGKSDANKSDVSKPDSSKPADGKAADKPGVSGASAPAAAPVSAPASAPAATPPSGR